MNIEEVIDFTAVEPDVQSLIKKTVAARICAERTAIVKAVSEGKRKFKVLAVVADKENNTFTTPCGLCRQTIAEFGDIPIYLAEPLMKSVLRTSLSKLLPCAFGLGNAEILQ
ncbi:cytidine deaminase-like isoform X3 [Frieseomelitta varia]|uniref:cytidine deaminase-like isoform X3 n=1 Tax=Frieseomelitta varia TaxID=561572 RepID=UPI001CB69B4D|nr:cytidine deaminase-like isoform X3 [Frieseomelitta varia]